MARLRVKEIDLDFTEDELLYLHKQIHEELGRCAPPPAEFYRELGGLVKNEESPV